MKIIAYSFFHILLSTSYSIHAQIVHSGIQAQSMGGQQVLVRDGAATIFLNPALLVEQANWAFYFSRYNPYAIKNLSVNSLAVSHNVRKHAAGLGYLQFGNGLYTEKFLFAAAGLTVRYNIKIGLKYKMRHVEIQKFGTTSASYFDFGIVLPVAPFLEAGLLVNNIISSSNAHSTDRLKKNVLTALRLQIHPGHSLLLEISQRHSYKTSIVVGLKTSPIEGLNLQFGMGLREPAQKALGVELLSHKLTLSYALASHFSLQHTHIFALKIRLQNKTDSKK